MPQITAIPKFVNAPSKTKYASINVEGVYYSFDPAKIPLSSFTKGVAATFEYTTNEKGYHNISRVIHSANSSGLGGGMSSQQEYIEGRQDAKDNKITRLAIAKSCIEANAGTDTADMWLSWVLEH